MESLREPAQFAGTHEAADCGLAGIAALQSPDLVALHENLSPLPFVNAEGVLVGLADSWTGLAEMEILL